LIVQTETQTDPKRQLRVGELVQVRSRRSLGDEVIDQKIPAQTSIVRLSCADDNAEEQSLEVLWYYAPDRLILEEEAWTDLAAEGFDEPRRFAALLHTLRWNCVTATHPNVLQAPFPRPDPYEVAADQPKLAMLAGFADQVDATLRRFS
jgi:hypothetical protein